ncbi:MAG: hypothetical protein E7047_10045 [Lentisphaerae bacterium]|nr:hypothetical protein [Lentisphaerota bacterium]
MADFTTPCPQCKTVLQVSTELIGSVVACPTCGHTFTVSDPAADVAAPPISTPQFTPQQPAPGAAPQFSAPQFAPQQSAPGAAPQFSAPQFAPQQSAPANGKKFAAVTGNAAEFARNSLKKGGLPLYISLAALVIALGALIYSIFFINSMPQMSFKKDPKKACKAFVDFQIEVEALRDYNVRKNGGEVLSSFEVSEVIQDGDYAAVFYKLSRGATTVKDTMILKRNKDGYYLKASLSDGPEGWRKKVSRKQDDWEKGSASDPDDLYE